MSKESHSYSRPNEGVAVVLVHNDQVAVVRHAENPNRHVQFGALDLPRETRERKNGYFEPLTKTLQRTLTEELGISEQKRRENLRTIGYKTMDCERPNGEYIKAHIVVMESDDPLSALVEPTLVDSTEIIGIEELPLSQVLIDNTDTWRTGPDGRDLLRTAFPSKFHALREENNVTSNLPQYQEFIISNHD